MQEMIYSRDSNLTYDLACKGCVYLGRAGSIGICNYIFMKGKPRPCPPSKDCTVKETKKRRKEA